MVSQNSPAALQWQMKNIRGSLSEHAEEAVEKARREFEWRHYVAKHPWMSLGTAAAVGFFLVPRRACCKAAKAEAVTDTVDRVARSMQPSPVAGLAAGLLSAVATTVTREGLALVAASVKKLLDPGNQSLERSPAGRSDQAEVF